MHGAPPAVLRRQRSAVHSPAPGLAPCPGRFHSKPTHCTMCRAQTGPRPTRRPRRALPGDGHARRGRRPHLRAPPRPRRPSRPTPPRPRRQSRRWARPALLPCRKCPGYATHPPCPPSSPHPHPHPTSPHVQSSQSPTSSRLRGPAGGATACHTVRSCSFLQPSLPGQLLTSIPCPWPTPPNAADAAQHLSMPRCVVHNTRRPRPPPPDAPGTPGTP
jgi:hypothetical protein